MKSSQGKEQQLDRRTFLTAAGTLAGTTLTASLLGCRSNPTRGRNGLIPVRLQADWYPQPEQGGFYTGIVKGIYEAEGLDVSIIPLNPYGSAVQLLASGHAEFGLGSSDAVLQYVSNGLPLVAVGATMQHDPQALMVHPDSPVHNFTDLENRSVAAQPGATWLRYLVGKYKLKNVHETPATHSVANFLADPTYIQQIFATSEPFFVTRAGGTYRTLLISQTGYDPYRVFFTRRDLIEQNPEVVARFVRASIKGWQEYLQDPAPANAFILKLNPAQNPDQMKFTIQAMKDGNFITGADKSGADIGKMNAERWTALNQQLTSLGVITNPIDPTQAYSLKFIS
jgi:NitT/TauT family transport system substrate-binding protein